MSQYVDRGLIEKYDMTGPRYTSYPTAVEFTTNFQSADYRMALHASRADTPLSIYIHVPFCDTLCYYCACNKIITKDRRKSPPFLHRLKKEIAMVAKQLGRRYVKQMHWGGGTPTFLSDEEIHEVLTHLSKYFDLDPENGEYAIEIDPRSVDEHRIKALRAMGFNRISFGVQDLNPKVQKAVHRIQPIEVTENALKSARDAGFQSVHLDLIYGLPFQSEASFSETLQTVIQWRPDRLSVFNYAHLPHIFMPQKRIRVEDLPSPEEKLRILERSISELTEAGYQFIGMDHFALPDNELAQAQRDGTLHRNFQGYTTHAECDLVGFGPSAIGQLPGAYVQNVKTLEEYYDAIDNDRLPVWRGKTLTQDDKIRRAAIMQLICHFELDMHAFSEAHNIDFETYFDDALAQLKQMEVDGLVTISDHRIKINDIGRLLVRNVCMPFDKYLQRMREQISFSKTI